MKPKSSNMNAVRAARLHLKPSKQEVTNNIERGIAGMRQTNTKYEVLRNISTNKNARLSSKSFRSPHLSNVTLK